MTKIQSILIISVSFIFLVSAPTHAEIDSEAQKLLDTHYEQWTGDWKKLSATSVDPQDYIGQRKF